MKKPANRWGTRLLKKPLLCFSFALLLCMLAYVYQSVDSSQTRSSLAASTPVEIGNRVWLDTNQNGLQDSGEQGIRNVTVHLYGSDGKLEATEITDANGNYTFTVSPDGRYQIRLDNPADYAAGGSLHGYQLTVANSDCEHARDSRAVLPNASQTISVKNYPQVNVDHLTAGQNNNTFSIGFVQGTNKSLEQKSKWVDGRCPPDYDDKPEPTVGPHPIPTKTPTTTSTPTPTVAVMPSPTPKKPVTLPTKTVPTTFPKLPATGSNPYGFLLP
jgi:hypothetical protein